MAYLRGLYTARAVGVNRRLSPKQDYFFWHLPAAEFWKRAEAGEASQTK